MKEKAFISVILYLSNNAGYIGELLRSVDEFLDEHFENYEIIAVNDASTDSSQEEIRQVFPVLRRDITLVNLSWRHGPEKGILSGVDLAIGDFVVEIEAGRVDYDPSLIYDLFREASKGIDIVDAVRSRGQSATDRLFYAVFNTVSYLPFKAENESARIVSRRAVNSIMSMNERVIYRGLLYKFSGFPDKTLYYVPDRKAVTSGMPLREKIRLALDVMVSYSNVGPNISVLLAVAFLGLSFILGLYALFIYFTYKQVMPGWTTTILFMSVCFCGVFGVLALQGRYISSIISDMKRRPTYIVKSIERSSRQKEGGNK